MSFRLTLISLLLFFFNDLGAQYSVIGKLTDADGTALGYANVVLQTASDSAFVSGTTTGSDGQFELIVDRPGRYRVSISSLGYESHLSSPFLLDAGNQQKNLEVIRLAKGGLQLRTVEVTAAKPVFEKQTDRLVLNLDKRVATAGATAMEVLERSPGVIVNRSAGSIGLLGKEGVNIMINGKLNYVPVNALLQYLEGLNADNILKIELITTPPAKLDAQGKAGFINIVLKGKPEEGLKGNYSLSGGYGRGEVGNAGLNFNFRKGEIGWFGSYSYNRNGQEQFMTLERRIGDHITNLTSDRQPTRNNHSARLGLDYQIGNKTTVGGLLSGYLNNWDMDATNSILHGASTDTSILSLNREVNDWKHLQTNLNVTHQFSDGGTLAADFDYLFFDNDNPTTYDLTYRDGSDIFLEEQVFTTKATPFNIRVGKMDYRRPVGKTAEWSAGWKYVRSDFENDVLVENDGQAVEGLTSKSDLDESIIALYSEIDYPFNDRWSLKGGLRYEYTDTELHSSTGGRVVDRSFGALFPSFILDYQINSSNRLSVAYSRRINRPAFSDMAPFIIFLDPNTSFGGNAALQPAIANTVSADYRFKTINLTLQYTREDSTIARFQNRFDPEMNTQLIVPDNLKEQQTASLSVAFPLKLTEWWRMRWFGMWLWQRSTNVEEFGQYTFDQRNLRLNGSQSFRLPKGLNLELSGFYQTSSLVGNVRFDPLGLLNIGIRKQFKNGSRLTFAVNDLFNTLKRTGTTELSSESLFVSRTFDFSQRTFRLTFSSSFGNPKVKASNERDSGTEEKKRVN